MATRDEIEACVRKNRGGELQDYTTMARFGSIEVWEVWTFAGVQYHTRYVVVKSGTLTYHSDFLEFTANLHDQVRQDQDALTANHQHQQDQVNQQVDSLTSELQQLRDQLGDVRAKRFQNSIVLGVGAIVFMASVVVLFILILNGAAPNAATFGVLASLVASGGAMIYGTWRAQKPG